MIDTTLEQELLAHLHALSPEQQQQALAFVRSLAAAPRGVAGRDLLPFAGGIAAADLQALGDAIAEGCEQVVPDEW
jgi:hypothetical protein